MVHKIWEKDTSDSEHGSIKEHLIKSFHSMLMDPPHTFSNPNEKVANDLLFLVAKMDFAQLTSLEQLIITMVNLEQIPKLLPETLWNLFCKFTFIQAQSKMTITNASTLLYYWE
jgi:hypothetical protein